MDVGCSCTEPGGAHVNLELRQIVPSIGSEVIDVDLERATVETMMAIKRALNDRMVLVFREQRLSRDAHKRLGRFFGTGILHQHKLVPKGQDPDIIAIKND